MPPRTKNEVIAKNTIARRKRAKAESVFKEKHRRNKMTTATHAESTAPPKSDTKEVPPQDLSKLPVAVAASPAMTHAEAEAKDKNEPPKIVDASIVEGPGGPLAVETKRGLVKGFPGDTLVVFSDGSKLILPKDAADFISAAKKLTDKKAEDKKKEEEKAKKEAEGK